ncbi:MAG TPA: DUF4440 domain-containing protein [Cyclobacteriaceae bacterium]|nr:DUF4440 domain-containing protein [Cyclobacteriaceae bacterium]
MKLNYTLLAIVCAIASSYGQKTTKQTQTAKDEAAIRTLVTDIYGAKVNANEAAPYAKELFADDVLWAPPDAPDRRDKAGIQAGMQNTFDKFTLAVQPSVEEIKVYGEFAYAIGGVDVKLTPKAGGDAVPVKFRIFWLLTKQTNGNWLISRQIWNKKPIS